MVIIIAKIKSSWDDSSLLGIVLVLPLFLLIVGAVIYPVIEAIKLSFTNIGYIGAEYEYVGLRNYFNLLGSSNFWRFFLNSVIWTLGNAFTQVILGFITALIINQKFKGKTFARTWIILSWIIPTVVLALMWRWILNVSFGVINYLIQVLNIVENPVNFLGTLSGAMPTVIFVNSWRWFPFFAVIILAGLQTIPRMYYEAAEIDGGTGYQKFRYITLPLIRPLLSILGIVGTLWSISIFDVIFLLTRGGPAGATKTVPLFIYERGFQEYAMRDAVTGAIILSTILIIFIVAFVKLDPAFGKDFI